MDSTEIEELQNSAKDFITQKEDHGKRISRMAELEASQEIDSASCSACAAAELMALQTARGNCRIIKRNRNKS